MKNRLKELDWSSKIMKQLNVCMQYQMMQILFQFLQGWKSTDKEFIKAQLPNIFGEDDEDE